MKQEEKDRMKKVEALKRAYEKVFEGDAGKLVLEDLERYCFIKTTTFTGDGEGTIFNEGRRSVLLHIETMRSWDLEKLKEVLGYGDGNP